MKFIEFKHRDNTKSLRCIETGWEVSDNGEFPALWTNEDQGIFSKTSAETYAQLKPKLLAESWLEPQAQPARPALRRVKYSAMEWVTSTVPEEGGKWVYVPRDEAWFHQFGLEIDEDNGQNYSVAILEKDDGEVLTVQSDFIQFIDGGAA